MLQLHRHKKTINESVFFFKFKFAPSIIYACLIDIFLKDNRHKRGESHSITVFIKLQKAAIKLRRIEKYL